VWVMLEECRIDGIVDVWKRDRRANRVRELVDLKMEFIVFLSVKGKTKDSSD